MRKYPLISVIIPVYNVDKYLNKCVNSVLNQSFNDFEVILVDDGSPDNSPEICDEFSESDERVIVIHKDNEGVGLARNSGFQKASGKYLFFLDSDDFIESNFFDVLIPQINKNFDIIQYGFNRVNEGGKYVNCNIPPRLEIKKLIKEKGKLAKILYSGCGLAVWDKIIKRDFLIKNKILFDKKKRGQDFTFIIKLYHVTKSIMVIDKGLINYRIIYGTGSKFDAEIIQNHLTNFSSLISLLDDKSLNSERFLQKIFSTWFFIVIPIHMASNNMLSTKEKISNIEALYLDDDFSIFLNKTENLSARFFEKVMLYLYLKKKFKLIIVVGKSLSLIRKYIYK